MKNNIIIYLACAILFTSCVQKSYEKTVVVKLTVPNKKDIKTVGIRGNGKPLSWNSDYLMKEILKDSLYEAVVKTKTAYKFAEIKFTVNDEWELGEKPNRRILFNEKGDTTYVNVVFNKK